MTILRFILKHIGSGLLNAVRRLFDGVRKWVVARTSGRREPSSNERQD